VLFIEDALAAMVTTGTRAGGTGFEADVSFQSGGSTLVDLVGGELGSAAFARIWSDSEGLWRESLTFTEVDGIVPGGSRVAVLAEALLGELDVADFDGDGFDDVVGTLQSSPGLNVFFGDGEGAFRLISPTESEFFLSVAVGELGEDVKAGDFDGDGNRDIAVTLPVADGVAILLGDGEGGFADPVVVSTGLDSDPTRLAVGDVNEDGRDDLAVVGRGRNELIVLLSDP
jgi:hypothetical protein